MKTKLLRKVRKRYQILWYPKGDLYMNVPYYRLIDISLKLGSDYFYEKRFYIGISPYTDCEGFPTELKAYRACKDKLISWILTDYKKAGIRRNKLHKPTKVWYNGV